MTTGMPLDIELQMEPSSHRKNLNLDLRVEHVQCVKLQLIIHVRIVDLPIIVLENAKRKIGLTIRRNA